MGLCDHIVQVVVDPVVFPSRKNNFSEQKFPPACCLGRNTWPRSTHGTSPRAYARWEPRELFPMIPRPLWLPCDSQRDRNARFWHRHTQGDEWTGYRGRDYYPAINDLAKIRLSLAGQFIFWYMIDWRYRVKTLFLELKLGEIQNELFMKSNIN